MSAERTVERLAAEVRRHRDLYYNGTPELSDAEFDAIEDRLRALAPDHPVLAEVGARPPAAADTTAAGEAPTGRGARTGSVRDLAWLRAMSAALYERDLERGEHLDYEATHAALAAADPDDPRLGELIPPRGAEWPKARHQIPMGSLNKVNEPEELAAWAARCDELAAADGGPPPSSELAVTEKLDGISLEVVYVDGRLDAAITRGDGVVGERITPNVRRMKGVPETIDRPGVVSLRGEVVLKRSDAPAMIALRHSVDDQFDGQLSLRNTAAGAARAKSARFLPGCRLLSALFYDVEGVEGLETEADKFDFIRAVGAETPSLEIGDLAHVQAVYDRYVAERRAALDYEIDGLVVRANRIRSFALLGELNNRPRGAVAFKFGSEVAITSLREILWETGDSGRITPVAVVDPVRLVGAQVSRASLHNLANVRALGIGVGDEVLISRRNDVIPYVERVEVKGPETAEPPSVCGRCEAPVEIEGEYLVCRNDDCPARRIGRLKAWVNALGLLEWGDKTYQLFFERGLAREPADLYRLDLEQLTALDGFGDKRARRLIEPLQARKEIPLATFIAALGIESVSTETAKLLVAAGYDGVDAILAATEDELAAVPGLGRIKADKIRSGLAARREEVARLAELGVVPSRPSEGGPLAGLSFCFSGSHARPRKELQSLVESNGGTVKSGVTKGLSYLVLADPSSTSSKAEKARKLGTEVIGEDRLDALISERGGPTAPG